MARLPKTVDSTKDRGAIKTSRVSPKVKTGKVGGMSSTPNVVVASKTGMGVAGAIKTRKPRKAFV